VKVPPLATRRKVTLDVLFVSVLSFGALVRSCEGATASDLLATCSREWLVDGGWPSMPVLYVAWAYAVAAAQTPIAVFAAIAADTRPELLLGLGRGRSRRRSRRPGSAPAPSSTRGWCRPWSAP
jgi:hypothetical protein